MIKKYIIIFISEVVLLYSFFMLILKDHFDIKYIAITYIAINFITKNSLKFREEGKKKSIYFSFLIVIIAILEYLYLFNVYNKKIISYDSLWFLLLFIGIIYHEFAFYNFSLEKLKKKYK